MSSLNQENLGTIWRQATQRENQALGGMHTAPSQNAMRALVGFLQEHHNIWEIGAQFVRTHREASLWLQLVTAK